MLVICPQRKYGANIRICPQRKYGANIRICPLISVFALIYPYFPPNSTSVSVQWSQILYVKVHFVQGKMIHVHKDMHKIVFQSN